MSTIHQTSFLVGTFFAASYSKMALGYSFLSPEFGTDFSTHGNCTHKLTVSKGIQKKSCHDSMNVVETSFENTRAINIKNVSTENSSTHFFWCGMVHGD